jgi:hypothetical protein
MARIAHRGATRAAPRTAGKFYLIRNYAAALTTAVKKMIAAKIRRGFTGNLPGLIPEAAHLLPV